MYIRYLITAITENGTIISIGDYEQEHIAIRMAEDFSDVLTFTNPVTNSVEHIYLYEITVDEVCYENAGLCAEVLTDRRIYYRKTFWKINSEEY